MDNALIFSIFTVATLKAQRSFWILEVSSRCQGYKGPLTQSQWGAFPTCSLLSSAWPLTEKTPGIPLSLQRSRWILHFCALMASMYNVSTKALHFCGSDVPGHRTHTAQYAWSSLSSSWPEAGTLYSCSWSEYSLSDLCDARSEVPSSG